MKQLKDNIVAKKRKAKEEYDIVRKLNEKIEKNLSNTKKEKKNAEEI